MKTQVSRAIAITFCGGIAASGLLGTAMAAAPLPGDLFAPPPNISVAELYNSFGYANKFYTPNGTELGNTRIATDVPIIRLVHSFTPYHGIPWGVQVIAPYTAFLGQQKVGGTDLSSNSGFAEPLFSVFAYPISTPRSTLALAYYLSPPIGAYNDIYSLNASSNSWVNNLEIGYRHTLLGNPKGRHLDLQVWGDVYFYGDNTIAGSVPTAPNEKLHTQTSTQLIVYLPYYFHPKTDSYVGLSFEQTFGGKQTITYNGLAPGNFIDTGNRNDSTSVGVIAGTFIRPTVFLQAQATTTVRARGGARNAVALTFQIGKIF